MITITRLDFTCTVDALVTAACRHAKHAQPGTAVALYDIATDLNEVAKKIAQHGLGELLNSKLPPADAVPVDEEDTGVNGQIMQLIADSDGGLTNEDLAQSLGVQTATVRKITASLYSVGKLAFSVEGQAKRYVLASAQPAAPIVDDEPVEVPPAVVGILNSPAPRPASTLPRRADEGKTYQRMLTYIKDHPLCTKDEIAHNMNIVPTTVDYHLKRMQAFGDIALDHQRRGRANRYRAIDQQPATVAA